MDAQIPSQQAVCQPATMNEVPSASRSLWENKMKTQRPQVMVPSDSLRSPAFDPSCYTHKELIDIMEESKRIC